MTETRRPFFTALAALLGLCPLLPACVDLRTGLLLGGAVVPVALIGAAAASLLRSSLADWQRWPTLTLLLAIVIGAIILCVRAFAYDSYQTAATWLPLLLGNCLLLSAVDAGTAGDVRHALRNSLPAALAMALLLIGAGALRQGLSADTLGGAALIGAGLIVAAKNHWSRDPQQPPSDNEDKPRPGTRRGRVTGPVR